MKRGDNMETRENLARRIARVQHPDLEIRDNANVTPNDSKTGRTVFCIDDTNEQVDVFVWESDITSLLSIHPHAMESVLRCLAD